MEVKERAQEDCVFKITIEGKLYEAYISTDWLSQTCYYYIYISEIKRVKILWFHLNVPKWEHKYLIHYCKLFTDGTWLRDEKIGDKTFYHIEDVKRWCKYAIEDYFQSIESEKIKEKELKLVKHVNFIDAK